MEQPGLAQSVVSADCQRMVKMLGCGRLGADVRAGLPSNMFARDRLARMCAA